VLKSPNDLVKKVIVNQNIQMLQFVKLILL